MRISTYITIKNKDLEKFIKDTCKKVGSYYGDDNINLGTLLTYLKTFPETICEHKVVQEEEQSR